MPERSDDPQHMLRLSLRANAIFSSACALIFLFDSEAVGAWTGVPSELLLGLGIGLLAFAALLLTTSLRSDPERLRREARMHCAADLAWVVGSVPVIALGWLTPDGDVALAGVSAVVLALAVAQWRGVGFSARSSAA